MLGKLVLWLVRNSVFFIYFNNGLQDIEFESGVSTICDGNYLILIYIQLKGYSYSKLL